MNKKKILNDPLYGFVSIPNELIFDLINHPFFQRLRRIKQLGLAEYVYAGALHTRFHHALGAMHLMSLALNTLRSKGHEISEIEYEAALIAILLHDIGHSPFSHSLEFTLLADTHHETLSLLIMKHLNGIFDQKLQTAIDIFTNQYPRQFFHQLVSSQIDMDRLDYLQRDCFYTGVLEGTIGADRIIRMLELVDDQLVIEEKGIYSIEHFLQARRVMYWQVYLHKTNVSLEQILIKIINRAKDLYRAGENIFLMPFLKPFFEKNIKAKELLENSEYIEAFGQLDDYDLWACFKQWTLAEDRILAELCKMLLERRLWRLEFATEAFEKEKIQDIKTKIGLSKNLNPKEVEYFFANGVVSNSTYLAGNEKITILRKNGNLADITAVSDLPNIKALSKIVRKYYISYPKDVSL